MREIKLQVLLKMKVTKNNYKMAIMKINTIILGLLFSVTVSSCDDYSSPEKNQGLNDTTPQIYVEQYDPISNAGQYIFPEMKTKPKRMWSCVEVLNVGSRNTLGQTEKIRGLQYHLMAQSLAGLANKAVEDGRSQIGVWLYDHEGRDSYNKAFEALKDMGIAEQGMQSGLELARNNYGTSDGINVQLKDFIDGYVLTDIENNPESANVATIAANVYNSIIVDSRDKDYYEEAGYTMTYDARTKTTQDAWNEFKDKCNKDGLVVMPVQTGELREFAIQNGFFVLNINKENGTASGGQNTELFKEILSSLNQGAPIFGWEQGIDEASFVSLASQSGHVWIPNDWTYNIPLTSLLYKSRQTSTLANVKNPQNFDYDKKKNYISYYLSDGDNIQWMMNNFVNGYYSNSDAEAMKMGFGIPVGNLAMLAPSQFTNIVNLQNRECSLVESLGGGYLYVDNYGSDGDRANNLAKLATNVAASMRQHRVKIMGVMALDVDSPAAKEGFQAYVDANDQLEGIIAMQYSPYAGGEGQIFWVTNKAGYDIPVVTIKYSLWNFGTYNSAREGTPAYIANKLKSEASDQSFSVISVHAWSSFSDIGNSNDELAENTNGTLNGASAAKLCTNHLGDNFEVITVQEMMWRIRMANRPEQTKKYLSEVF